MQINKDDRISTMLCINCVDQLMQIAEFRLTLIASNEFLLRRLSKVDQYGDKSIEAEYIDDESEKADCGNETDIDIGENVVLLEIENAAIDLCQMNGNDHSTHGEEIAQSDQIDVKHNIHSVFPPKSKSKDGHAEQTAELLNCQCDICKKYYSPDCIGWHMRSHTKISHRPKCLTVAAVAIAESTTTLNGSADKPFPCAYCSLRLKNVRRLEEHTRVHTGKSLALQLHSELITYTKYIFYITFRQANNHLDV